MMVSNHLYSSQETVLMVARLISKVYVCVCVCVCVFSSNGGQVTLLHYTHGRSVEEGVIKGSHSLRTRG